MSEPDTLRELIIAALKKTTRVPELATDRVIDALAKYDLLRAREMLTERQRVRIAFAVDFMQAFLDDAESEGFPNEDTRAAIVTLRALVEEE